MPLTEGELQAARSTAAYRAAVWFLRLSTALLVVYVVSLCSGFLRNKPALDAGLLAAVVITSAIDMVLFHRAGLQFLKGDRRTTTAVWKDVCWLTRR